MFKQGCIFILLMIACSQLHAQSSRIDSLTQLLKTTKSQSEKANILTELSTEHLQYGNYSKVLEGCAQALEIFITLRDTSGMAKVMFILGSTYYELSEYDKALEYKLNALRNFELINNKEGIASVQNSLGLIYYKLTQYHKALEYFQNALHSFQEFGNQQHISFAFNNIGMVYFAREDFTKSLNFHLKALEIKQQLGDKGRIVTSLNNIGEIYMEQEDFVKALEYFLLALAMKQELGNSKSIAITACNIGKLYMRTGNYAKSDQYLQMSLQHALDAEARFHQAEAYQWLSELQAKKGNYQKALEYNKLYIQTKDSIFNQESDQRIANLHTIYEVEKKDKKIQLSKARVELLEKDAQIRENRNRMLILISAGLTGILIMLVIAIRLKSKTIRQNKIVHEQENKMNELTIMNQQIENERLTEEVEHKNRELSTVTMHIFDKNEMLNQLNEQVRLISTQSTKLHTQLKPLKRAINKNLNLDDDWQNFKTHFEQVHPDFFSRLKQQTPSLTPADHRHCAYIKMNLSTKEIARLLNISPASVQKSRVRLKKKMGLPRATDLITFLQNH